MWEIYEAKEVERSLKKIPTVIKKNYKAWIEVVKNGGSKNLMKFPGFRDKQLSGELRECRSLRLNIQYRVVYHENKRVKEIYVFKITPHRYKK